MKVVAPLLVVVVAGCADARTCHLVGCGSALTVVVAGAAPAAFVVAATIDGRDGIVECGALNEGARATTSTSGALRGDDDGAARDEVDAIHAWCASDGVHVTPVAHPSAPAPRMPASARFVVTQGDRTLVAEAESIAYDVLQPNGPDCAPTCFQATLTARPTSVADGG